LELFLKYNQEKHNSGIDFARKIIEEMLEKKDQYGQPLVYAMTQITPYSNDVFNLIRAYDVYVGTLETYLAELDETIDKTLEQGKKEAEKRIEQAPRPEQAFYT